LVLLGALALAAVRLGGQESGTFEGPVRVIDGDSLASDGRRFRLIGIDAPEIAQRCRRDGFEYPCGVDAASHLRGLIGRQWVDCAVSGLDRYRRELARCRAGGIDLNAAMVRSGFAVDFGGYATEEAAARLARSGVWSGDFDRPKDWRAIHGGLDETIHGLLALARLRSWWDNIFGSNE